ncbi:hypothetical protein HN51_015225 [Arachis hypogaea]|nr:uncharacterized protein DS421_6g173320 [Arachis hypogaea]
MNELKQKFCSQTEFFLKTGTNTAHKALNVIHELQSKRKTGAQGKEPNAADDKAGGAEILTDGDEYQNEKIGLAAEKHELLSSRCTSGRDISTSTRLTESNVCMKCKEAGKLLVCRTTTCPIMVHESCLTSQIDAEGNFLCPFCVCYQAFSRCVEAKKKASLARKELASFIRI